MSEAKWTPGERRRLRWFLVLACVTGFVLAAAAALARPAGLPVWITAPAAALAAAWIHRLWSRRLRRRAVIRGQPFPPEWEAVLQRDVVFFRALPPEDQRRFRKELQVFIAEKRITGIDVEIDPTVEVLAAASAIIPIFGFPEWEWDQISEVLIYPARFDQDFQFGDRRGHNTLGMVGTGPLNRVMILSKPDLLAGFRNPRDKRNVGIHEFAHLVDKSDGRIDGLPGVGLGRSAIGPWIDLVRRKMAEIERGDSDIDPYALTNEAEFFAVATEYFFERPGVMQRKHPELYATLARVFGQDLKGRAQAMLDAFVPARRFGRNSPCPCGSGEKYKRCCLKRARRARRAG
jgi:Mlc titration factor MtfA (ptsG expression regulator)